MKKPLKVNCVPLLSATLKGGAMVYWKIVSELSWSQLLLFFLLLKYDVVHQWCISWKLRQISNCKIKLVVFTALHIFRLDLENHCYVLFLPVNCSKQVLLGSWWVSGADRKYYECILLKFDIWDGSHLLLIIFAIFSVNFFMFTFKTISLLFAFHKRRHSLMKNQHY